MWRIPALALVFAALAGGAYVVLPKAERALALRLAEDDPVRLSELRLAESFDAAAAVREIEAALAANDRELAESFVALADRRSVPLPADLRTRAAEHSLGRTFWESARSFGRGFVAGDARGAAGLLGATSADFLVYGDVRDLAREGWNWSRGEAVDPFMLGLASAGLAVTAGTYASRGRAAPARATLSLFKVARRTGTIGVELATDLNRLARNGGMVWLASTAADVGRVEGRAGARAALEGLRVSESAGDVARVARLADGHGNATLAALKTLGRGAIVVGAGALTAAFWVMGGAAHVVLLILAATALFASAVRMVWGTGRRAWRGGRFAFRRAAAGP